MIINNKGILLLTISLVIVFYLIYQMRKKKEKNNLTKLYLMINIILVIYVVPLILQMLFVNTNIKPIYFDYVTYIGVIMVPVVFYIFSREYEGNPVKNKKVYFIIPVISLLILWTSDFHHLFYARYSTNMSEVRYGKYFYVHMIYTYGLMILAFINIIKASIKKSGFLTMQTLILLIGALVPAIVNILGSLKIISITIYITPVLFIVTSVCFYIAIFKLKAFNIIPVASRTVMDTMSDAYVVISNDGTIADSNKTFKTKFKDVFESNSDENLFETFDKSDLIDLSELKKHIAETRRKGTSITQEYHFCNDKIDRYFELDIHPISARDNKKDYVATLLVFKDITQHKQDIAEIESKQDIIVKQQQLVSIGELAGGVAHDINTPISAIKTGIVMLNSMGETRTDSEKEILIRMDNCATKIINIVNSMRNQIRNLGGTTNVKFNVKSVIEDIKIITYHEVAKNQSKVEVKYEDEVEIVGDPTKLGQVLTNLVVNGAQAYGEKGGKIDIIVRKVNNLGIINVIDYAGGIPEEIKPYIFKNILTTKGIKGTGLGLYIAYSVIKGQFNGELSFDSKEGEGTTFTIKIPIS